jgi:hypothetical protein
MGAAVCMTAHGPGAASRDGAAGFGGVAGHVAS